MREIFYNTSNFYLRRCHRQFVRLSIPAWSSVLRSESERPKSLERAQAVAAGASAPAAASAAAGVGKCGAAPGAARLFSYGGAATGAGKGTRP